MSNHNAPGHTAHVASDDFDPPDATGADSLGFALRGDEADLFARYHDRLVRATAIRLRISHEIAQDAAQIAWLILMRAQPARESAYAWLKVVAFHEALRLLRREGRELWTDDTEVAWQVVDPVALEDQVLAREALRAVAELPDRQRRLYSLKLAGLSYEEIAGTTGDSLRTVDRQLRRANERLYESPRRSAQ